MIFSGVVAMYSGVVGMYSGVVAMSSGVVCDVQQCCGDAMYSGGVWRCIAVLLQCIAVL